MAIFRHTLEEVEEYKQNTSINQSALKVLIRDGIQAFVDQKDELLRQSDLFYEEKKHFIIGTGVDVTMTHTEEEFKATHYRSELVKKPGPKAMSTLQRAYFLARQEYGTPDADIKGYPTYIHQAANEEDYFVKRAKDYFAKQEIIDLAEDPRIETLLKDNGNSYWCDLVMAEGKQILTDEEFSLINTISNNFKTHKHTGWLFQDSPDVDIIYQLPLYFTTNDVGCKVLLDTVRIVHSKKRIFPIDIKTMGDYVIKFPNVVNIRRYDIQGGLYSEGIAKSKEIISNLIGKDVRDYTIANFAFAVESTIRPGTPLIYVLKEDMMSRGRLGGPGNNGRERFVGYEEALTKYQYWANLDFSLSKRFKDSNGMILLGADYDMNINI